MSNEREAAFLKLQEQRLAVLEKKKADRQEGNAQLESLTEFLGKFNGVKSDIDSNLAGITALSDSEKKSRLDHALKLSTQLQTLLNDALSFLPAYDLKKCQDAVTYVHDNLAKVQQDCLPKKKFTFGKKKKNTTVTESVTKPTDNTNKFSKYSGDVVYENITGQTLTPPTSEIYKKDVLLRDLKGCTVNLLSALGTLHCTNCTDCTFIVGPISGSIFLEGCNNSVYDVSCHQARIHTTHHATFHIHVTSKAIIEDCTNLKFGKRVQFYDGYDKDLVESGLGETNNWNDVDDFNWLSKDPSPNWEIVHV